MKLCIVAWLLTLFTLGLGYEMAGFFKDAAHPGKCVYDGLVLSSGEEGKVKGKCIRVLCGKEGFARIQGCGTQSVAPPCVMGDYINLDAPYGECCKRHITCP
ncbi:uncharacterized protein LOC106094260 [Stomoxys calcitrans]|uniref:Single domain-containing protein n=1 Tax=Stomoxys calcitrans TaxID=35570 RepID=A0A1I8PER7_STOCA|nr:uncharacterized protein LOC106094260 [Stomoxys calcitrans]XP_013116918.1 uncharacterized protein LOC106094260 [Stomoxys calcitrans]